MVLAGTLSALLVMPAAAQAEGSWCANKGGTGSANCGFYSFQQCTRSISGGGSFCTQNGTYRNYPPSRARQR
jgi:hypothetical protein